MSTLQPALARLEARLQALVEGSLARLFPANELRQELARRLFEALRREARQAPDGTALAPDHYILFLPAAQAQVLEQNPEWSQSLVQTLALELAQAAGGAGLQFQRPPVIRLLPDPEAGAGNASVLAQFSLDEATGQTSGSSTATSPLPALPLFSPDKLEEPPNGFLMQENGRIYTLELRVTNLGRGSGNHLALSDERVSELHAQIRLLHNRFTLFDLGAENGTFVNQRRIFRYDLSPGDVISLGGVLLVFGQENSQSQDFTQKLDGLA